jgi:hypothetical protein
MVVHNQRPGRRDSREFPRCGNIRGRFGCACDVDAMDLLDEGRRKDQHEGALESEPGASWHALDAGSDRCGRGDRKRVREEDEVVVVQRLLDEQDRDAERRPGPQWPDVKRSVQCQKRDRYELGEGSKPEERRAVRDLIEDLPVRMRDHCRRRAGLVVVRDVARPELPQGTGVGKE